MIRIISFVGWVCIMLAVLSSALSIAASLAMHLLILGLLLVFGSLIFRGANGDLD